jgi:hypothetical protein
VAGLIDWSKLPKEMTEEEKMRLDYQLDTQKMLFSERLKSSISEGTTQNRPDRNANPFNVKLGSLKKYGFDTTGMQVDDQGHVMFDSAKE